MGRREKLCLQMRNRNGQDKETYCRHYLKSKGVYLRSVFFGLKQTGMFLMCLIFTLVIIFTNDRDESILFKILPYIFAGISGFAYIFMILKGLWYWKYTRHVFVTDEGIWVMSCSALWWKGAPDFTGKRRFLAPSWSLYGWDELKSVSKKSEGGNRNISRIINFFEDYENFIVKSSKHTTIYLKRWDGVERVDFLKSGDAEEILSYVKTHKKSRKKKKEEMQEQEDNSEE